MFDLDQPYIDRLRDGLYMREVFYLPVQPSFRQFEKPRNGCRGFWTRQLMVGKGVKTTTGKNYTDALAYVNNRCVVEEELTIVIAIPKDVHHVRLTQKQALSLAKTLFHFWRTGFIKTFAGAYWHKRVSSISGRIISLTNNVEDKDG